jgi:hypothetical protein
MLQSNLNKSHIKTQNRNELCSCGSGKKFKKCCETILELANDQSYNKTVIGDIDNRELDITNSVLWRTSILNLPKEIKSVIEEFIKNVDVANYGCYHNSFSLSLFDNRIKTIKGWYGSRMNEIEIENSKLEFQESIFNRRFYKFNDNIGRRYIDTKNWIEYHPHSWNEINGITFDLTTESNPLFKKWIYYVKTETINLNPIISNKKIFEYYSTKSKEVSNRIKLKFGVNNSNLLNLINSEVSTFSMVA